MVFVIKKAEPIDGRILLALAGPQASGKTTSALRLATGITKASGGKICLIDTENKRSLKYANDFQFNHMPFEVPFSPLRYLEAIDVATSSGYGDGDVVIIDSFSHEHEGPGGVLDMHETFLNDKCGTDYGKRERLKFTAWIKPKADRMRVILMGLQRNRAHIILCFRAKEKVKMVKNLKGKMEVLNDGWQPIGGDEYFYEMDITMILPPGSQGKPDWSQNACRINEFPAGKLTGLLHSTSQISEDTGAAIYDLSKAAVGTTQPERTDQQKAIKVLAEKMKAVTSYKDLTDFNRSEEVVVMMKTLNPQQVEWWDSQLKKVQEGLG